jgi:hypothetical protein
MKVNKVEGYLSDDGTIFKTELEAIEDNVISIFRLIEDETSTTIESNVELLHWFKDNKDKLQYILDNSDKINLLLD